MIRLVGRSLTTLVALEQIVFMIVEMFFWNHPIGRSLFALAEPITEATSTLAANHGLCNGFLAAGLIWSLVSHRYDIRLFFLGCVIIAGLYGGITIRPSIMLLQAAPAAVAALCTALTTRRRPTSYP